MSFPHKPTVTISIITSHKCISRNQNVKVDHSWNEGGNKYPGVTLSTLTTSSENDNTYPMTTTTQINFTVGDVFPSKAENCCRKYGILRLNTRSAAIFMTDVTVELSMSLQFAKNVIRSEILQIYAPPSNPYYSMVKSQMVLSLSLNGPLSMTFLFIPIFHRSLLN